MSKYRNINKYINEWPVMKPVCHLLIVLTALLAACQPANIKTRPVPAPRLVLKTIVPPSILAGWQLQGSINHTDKMYIYRYQRDQGPKLDISLYPLPNGWETFTPSEALKRHFGMLSQQLATRAQNRFGATNVEREGGNIAKPDGEPAVINSRFISHFSNRADQVTLVSLTLYRGNFVRLTLSCLLQKADKMAPQIAKVRSALIASLKQQAHSSANQTSAKQMPVKNHNHAKD